jgi:hypothetical protein
MRLILYDADGKLITHICNVSDPNQEFENCKGMYGAVSWETMDDPLTIDMQLDELKKDKFAELDRQYQQQIWSGFISTALGEPHIYDSRAEDQINLMAAILQGEATPYACWDPDKTKQEWRMHSLDQLKQVFEDSCSSVMMQLQKFSLLKSRVERSRTPEEIQKINW